MNAQPEQNPLILDAEPVAAAEPQAEPAKRGRKAAAPAPAAVTALQTLPPAVPQQVVTPAATPTPMVLLQMAMSQGADLDRLERLMQLERDWKADQARDAFNAAFAAFKSESVAIIKNTPVNDGPLKGKKYADLFAVVDAITPALSKHGLSSSWKLTKDEKDWLEVTCFLRHEQGHSESVSMGGPPDTGGAKNAIQARASAKSYLERYTLLAITGMAASGEDTDGRAATFGMDEGAFQHHLKAIREAQTIQALQAAFTAAINASKNDKPTQAALIAAKDTRKGELRGATK